jgi:hypothetical protein
MRYYNKMIDLNEVQSFAQGGNRKCFINPDNPQTCLKLMHKDLITDIKNQAVWYKKLRVKSSFDDNLREEKAYKQNAISYASSDSIWNHLARWHGIIDSINTFESWLREHLVLTKNLIPHNIVIKQDKGLMTLKIVDGLGSKSFIPLPQYSKFFAKIYVERRIKLFWSRIHWDLSGRHGTWK